MRMILSVLLTLALASVAYTAIPLVTSPSWTSSDNDYATGGGFGDFNGDGYIDLATGNGQDMARNYNHVYINHNGVLETTASWASTEQRGFSHLMVGDLNHDGKPDLAVVTLGLYPSSQDTNPAVIYYNTGSALEHTASWHSHDRYASFDCDFGDVWGDGNLSMAVSAGDAYTNANRRVRMYRNRNGVMDTLPAWQGDTLASDALRFADLNNDGWLDLIVGCRHRLDVYLNNTGTLPAAPSWSTPNVGWVLRVALGDVNNDGWLDVAVASNGQNGDPASFKVFRNTNGTLENNASWTASIGGDIYPSSVAFGDVNNNGYPDLAAGSWGSSGIGSGRSIYVFENTGGNLSTNYGWSWTNTASFVSETVVWGDVRNTHLIPTADTVSGNGARRLWYLKHVPTQSFTQALVGGTPVPLSDYCVHPMSGWVSFKNAPPSGTNNVVFRYVYSYAPDLAVTNWSAAPGSYMFLNTTPSGTDELAGNGKSEAGNGSLSVSPNPFKETARISYNLSKASLVSLKAYDLSGRLVETFPQGDQPAGRHEATWSAKGLPAGVYLLRMEAGGENHLFRIIRMR